MARRRAALGRGPVRSRSAGGCTHDRCRSGVVDALQARLGGRSEGKHQGKIGHETGGGFTFTTSWIEGEIYVNNLAFAKRVGIRFSTDGGTTWQDSDAAFAGGVSEGTFATSSGAELWKFKTPELNLDAASTMFRFAIYYQNLATGEWFWDNKFGRDYRLSKNDGSTVE